MVLMAWVRINPSGVKDGTEDISGMYKELNFTKNKQMMVTSFLYTFLEMSPDIYLNQKLSKRFLCYENPDET